MTLLWDTEAARDTATSYLETARLFTPIDSFDVLAFVGALAPDAMSVWRRLQELDEHRSALQHDLLNHAQLLRDAATIVERHESLVSKGIRGARQFSLHQSALPFVRNYLLPVAVDLLRALGVGASVPWLSSTAGPPEWSLGARSIADWLTRTDRLGNDEFAVSLLEGPPPVAVVTLPGIHAFGDAPDSRDLPGAIREIATGASSYHEAVIAALQQLSLPKDSSIVLIGHSQGGIVAMDLSKDPRISAFGQVTHVVTAGSPIDGISGSRQVPVLELVNPDDAVPALAGNSYRQHPERITVQGEHGGVRSSHTLSGTAQSYATLISLPGVLQRPEVRSFTASASAWMGGGPSRTTVFKTGKTHSTAGETR